MFFARLRRKWRARVRRRREDRLLRDFDAVWYHSRYPDLAALRSVEEIRAHYLAHGRAERRFANARAEEEANFRRFLVRSDEFDITAYRLLNPDLARVFSEDRDFILHYIRNGLAEGRPATFGAGRDRAIALEPWMHLFDVTHYTAWVRQDADAPAFSSRAEALAHFRSRGIDALAPLNFDHVFEPGFYRDFYRSSETDEVALYRDWLEIGLPQGRAANEARALLPLIGHSAFPVEFDWRRYADSRQIASSSRAAVLAALFESEQDWSHAQGFLDPPKTAIALHLARYRLVHGRYDEAIAVIAVLAPDQTLWSPELHALHGELMERRGDVAAALAACREAARLGHPAWENLARAVNLAAALGEQAIALALLREQRDRWQGSAAFTTLVDATIDRLFAVASSRAFAEFQITPPDRDGAAEAEARFTGVLAELSGAIVELGLPPAPLSQMIGNLPRESPVVVLGDESVRQCTHYRLEQKAEQFAAVGIPLARYPVEEAQAFMQALAGARAAIFYRVPATPPVIRAIHMARAMGIPTWYEIDDLLFDSGNYPPPLSTYGGSISEEDWCGLRHTVPLFRFALALCDRAIASTPALLKAMAPLTRKGTGVVVRNGLDSRNRSLLALGSRERQPTGRVRIFYGSGTLAHAQDFTSLAAPALAKILAERDDVDLVLVGHVPADVSLDQFGSRVIRYPFISEVGEYWSVLAACDIAIAVLAPGIAADAKSEIKWLEAAAAAIPTVASDTATFKEVISPGATGLLSADPQGWYEALAALCADATLRQRIGRAAREAAQRHYSLDALGRQWREVLASPAVTPPAAVVRRRVPRVLVVNVFFSPQSIGGATRVVEDNVRHLAESGEFQLGVFCSDEGIKPLPYVPAAMRTSCFGKVPVFRAALPPRDDLLYLDEAVLPAFRRCLDLFAPDLVHFHCMQRLTAAPLQECLDRDLPYVVTLHDGWWISPYQFLVDGDGFLQIPGPDLFAGFSKTPAVTDTALRRRQALAPLLDGAARLTSVSEKFAEIYRNAGFAAVETVANGIPDLPSAMPNDESYVGPLRLAHIGGRSSHKGADLVEAALRRGSYSNISLLMIDGRFARGEVVHTQWGTTPVTLAAPWPQSDVRALYSEFDVLLAPSRWPESFGLVAREAAHFGCGVVASALGSIGDDVIPGETGYIIDPFASRPLDNAIATMAAAPERWRRRPRQASVPGRRARDQAAELARLYREILG